MNTFINSLLRQGWQEPDECESEEAGHQNSECSPQTSRSGEARLEEADEL